MQQLYIEVCGLPAYSMNVGAEIDGKPWYHDINTSYIKDGEYLYRATTSEKKFIRCMV